MFHKMYGEHCPISCSVIHEGKRRHEVNKLVHLTHFFAMSQNYTLL